jgi:hypothetical protein
MCSSIENLSFDLYVDAFVQDIMMDAIDLYYKTYIPHKEQVVVRRSSRSDAESTDSEFFAAEFSQPRPASASLFCKNNGHCFKMRGGRTPEPKVHRRGSLDEVAQFNRQRRCSGFKNSMLSDFQVELARDHSPTVFDFCECSASCKQRRASEPAAVAFADSHFDHLEVRRHQSCTSLFSSSREMILDWLDHSKISMQNKKRQRATSFHLDWFAQDLLIDVLSGALTEIFGPNYPAYHQCLQERSNSLDSSSSLHSTISRLTSTSNLVLVPDAVLRYADHLSYNILHAALKETRRSPACDNFFDAMDVPFSQIEMIADSFSWKIIEEARSIVRLQMDPAQVGFMIFI